MCRVLATLRRRIRLCLILFASLGMGFLLSSWQIRDALKQEPTPYD